MRALQQPLDEQPRGHNKPILEPMIQGRPRMLSLQGRLLVSTWAIKTALVLEFFRKEYHVNDDDDRRFLMSRQQPPPTFRVRLAMLEEIPQHALRFQTIVATNDLDTKEPNILCSTLLIGHLIIQTWGGPGMNEIDLRSTGSTSIRAIQIWPPTPSLAHWPPLQPIKEHEVENFLREPIPNRVNESFLDGWPKPPGSIHPADTLQSEDGSPL